MSTYNKFKTFYQNNRFNIIKINISNIIRIKKKYDRNIYKSDRFLSLYKLHIFIFLIFNTLVYILN